MTESPATDPAGDATGGADVTEHELEVLEYDETVPPRPEEEVADAARSVPDPNGHGGAQAQTAPVTARELP